MKRNIVLKQQHVKKKNGGRYSELWRKTRYVGLWGLKISALLTGLAGISVLFVVLYSYLLTSPYMCDRPSPRCWPRASSLARPGRRGRAPPPTSRLEALEKEVALLKRKLEVQQEEAASKASMTPVVGAGPDGFFLRSPDQAFQLKLRAFAQADSRWLLEPSQGGDDGFLIRRARLDFQGTLGRYIDFRIMPDFANSSLTLFNAYANLRYLPEAQLQVGKFKPPVGLERLQSATATMFIERAFPTNLVPSRDIGGMLWSELAEGLVAYQVGAFNGVRDNGTQDVDTDDSKTVAARLAAHAARAPSSGHACGQNLKVTSTP